MKSKLPLQSMRNKLICLLFLVFFSSAFSQDESGYWDKIRAETKEINLSAGQRFWQRIDIPTGTTQAAVRITLLEESQQLSNSLSSLLSSIPSPQTQVAAAGVTLLSDIAGDDKCRYFIFQNRDAANDYINTGNIGQACLSHTSDITRDVFFLSDNCIPNGLSYLYFGFHSTNAFFSERIILEFVPWVDNVASRGWTKEIKQNFFKNCVEKSKHDLTKTEDVCQCMLDKYQEKYKVQDFKNMTEQEISEVTKKVGEECLKETGEEDELLDKERQDARQLAGNSKYGDAANKLLNIINSDKGSMQDYNDIGFYLILTKQYLKANKYLKIAEQKDPDELIVKMNLAHATLFNGDVDNAKAMYIKYKTQNVTESLSWVDGVKQDFALFQKLGLPSDNFDSILSLLK